MFPVRFDTIRFYSAELDGASHICTQPTDVVNGSYLRFAVIRNIMIMFNFYGFMFWIIFIQPIIFKDSHVTHHNNYTKYSRHIRSKFNTWNVKLYLKFAYLLTFAFICGYILLF